MKEPSLQQQLRTLHFNARLEQAKLIAAYETDADQRVREAATLMRRIIMDRVFDKFSKDQEGEILDVLRPIAEPTSKSPGTQQELF